MSKVLSAEKNETDKIEKSVYFTLFGRQMHRILFANK
jgi:hypothetical protein